MHVYMSNNRYQLNPLEEYLCLGQTSWPIYNPINFTFHLYRNQRRNMWVQKDKIRVRRTILTFFFFFVTDNIDIHRHIYIPSNNTNSYLPSFTIFFSNLQPPIFTIYHIGNASYSLRKQKKIGSIARKSSNSYPYIYNTIYPFLFFFCFPSIFIYHLNL